MDHLHSLHSFPFSEQDVDADQDAAKRQAMSAFIAELRRLREISNYSQKALANKVGYTPSYVSKVERGTIVPSEEFARSADQHLRAGQDRTVFAWSAEDPPLHTRFRIEWKFTAMTEETNSVSVASLPSAQMKALGIVQEDADILHVQAIRFALPGESEDARRIVAQLVTSLTSVTQVHQFAKGAGLAAPQIGIGRSAAVVKTTDGDFITLLNPRIVAQSPLRDEQYEGCLSFFDVRGMTPRSLVIEVEHQETDGTTRITEFRDAVARLVAHEVDHLEGVLYTARMRPGAHPIPVSQYKDTGRRWEYREEDR